jgi:hypothetical protein
MSRNAAMLIALGALALPGTAHAEGQNSLLFGGGAAAGIAIANVVGPAFQLRGIVELPLGRGFTLRGLPGYFTTGGETDGKDFYGLPLKEKVRVHVILLPLLAGYEVASWLGVHLGPAVGIGWGHYERNSCAGGWKPGVPYGGQAEVVGRLGGTRSLEIGLTTAVLVNTPLIECTTGPMPAARFNDEATIVLGAAASYILR